MRVFAGFLIFAGLLAAAAPARSAPNLAVSLDGWGAFKFGMSPTQARAVPGQRFGRYGAKNLLDQMAGAMASKTGAVINGISYTLDLYFNSFQALNEISLQNEKTLSQSDCQDRFLLLLGQLEKTYGPFLPVYPEQKKNDQALLPISVEWKNSPGASRYQLATVYLNEETAYAWDARKVFGRRFVDAAAVWSAAHDDDQAVCLTALDYKE
jgi:hypothetical protein